MLRSRGSRSRPLTRLHCQEISTAWHWRLSIGVGGYAGRYVILRHARNVVVLRRKTQTGGTTRHDNARIRYDLAGLCCSPEVCEGRRLDELGLWDGGRCHTLMCYYSRKGRLSFPHTLRELFRQQRTTNYSFI